MKEIKDIILVITYKKVIIRYSSFLVPEWADFRDEELKNTIEVEL